MRCVFEALTLAIGCTMENVCNGNAMPVDRETFDLIVEAQESFMQVFFGFTGAVPLPGNPQETVSVSNSQLDGAGLVRRVQNRMELAATGQPGAKRFHLWSGHDTTVMPFLDLFGAWDGKWPPYAAMVTIELYRPKSGEGGAMVRMLYQGKDVTQKVRGCPQGGGQLCPYAAFKAVAAAAYAAM